MDCGYANPRQASNLVREGEIRGQGDLGERTRDGERSNSETGEHCVMEWFDF